MATVTYIKEKKQTVSAMRGVIRYCCQDQKVYDPSSGRRLVSGINCNGEDAFTEFMATKEAYGQVKGTKFYQYVQSFSPKEIITPEQAHEVALEFAAQAWPGHEVLVATHCDADHLHSHFIINSVSFENGHKLRQNPNTLKQLRTISDEICQKHGLSILPPKQEAGPKLSAREYRAAAKGQSWKFRLMSDIESAMERSGSQEDFIFLMKRRGYDLVWTQERKYITFICPNGMKCRDNKLHHSKFRKENIEHELHTRKQLTTQLFSGQAGETEFTVHGNLGEGTLPSHSLRYPRNHAAGVHESAEASSEIPADPIQSDQHPDNESRNAFPASADAGAGAGVFGCSVSRTGDSQRAGGADNEAIHLTGWEESREIYFRNFLYGGIHREGYAANDFRTPGADTEIDYPHHHAGSGGISAGLSAIADLGRLIEDDTEDEEESRKRIQAQQAGSDIGMALGLAIGAALVLSEEQVQEDSTMEQKM